MGYKFEQLSFNLFPALCQKSLDISLLTNGFNWQYDDGRY